LDHGDRAAVDSNHHRATTTGTAHGLPRQSAHDGSEGNARRQESRAESWSRSPERQTARLACLLCLGLTLLPLVIAAGLLAKGQLDNSSAVTQAEAAQTQALQNWQGTEREQTASRARVASDEEQLILASRGLRTGIPVKQLQETLQSDQGQLQKTTTNSQVAQNKYDNAQAATETARSRQGSPLGQWIIYVGALGALAIGDVLFMVYVYGDKRREFENRLIVQSLAESRSQLTDLTTQWNANEEQLNGYHQLVYNYAKSSRATTKFTLLSGFAFVLVLSIFALTSHSLASTVASSVIATAGAVVTGFIARAVLRNAENSSSEVIAFFSHPLETQRILTAQRIVDTMSDEPQQQAKLLMVAELVQAKSPERLSPEQLAPKRRAARTTTMGT
jgi:hypothetical protein